jgi:hypothetical protein
MMREQIKMLISRRMGKARPWWPGTKMEVIDEKMYINNLLELFLKTVIFNTKLGIAICKSVKS